MNTVFQIAVCVFMASASAALYFAGRRIDLLVKRVARLEREREPR